MNVVDEAFKALANGYRRQVLITLLGSRQPPEGVLIPEDVWEATISRRRLQIELTHHHLPMMEDLGYVEWDSNEQLVRRGPEFETIRPVLKLLVTNEEKLPGQLA